MLESQIAAPRRVLLGALAALAALALLAAAADTADAKKKRKGGSAAGLYVGNMINLVTPPGFPTPKVRFQLSPDGTISNFVITNLALICTTEDYNIDTDPNLRRQLETIAAPPMSLGAPLPRRGLPLFLRFSYEDPLPPAKPPGDPPPPPGAPPFRGIHVDGRTVAFARGEFRGHANIAIFNNTRDAVGTEECHFYSLSVDSYVDGSVEFDWGAQKVTGKRKKRKR